MEVRRARFEDAAALAEVHTWTWQGAYAHVFGDVRLSRMTPVSRFDMWVEVLTTGNTDVSVVEDGEGVVGFVWTGEPRDADAAAELYAIYVLPRAWGTGAGPALMDAGIAAMEARFSGDAVLWVLEDNPRARRFYEREGWVLDGARKEDEILGVTVTEIRYRRQLGSDSRAAGV